jgi:uncharacterized membrane protein SpoIIM required for sporulation
MIIDLGKFIREERPFWKALERILDRLESDAEYKLDLDGVKRFHYLYQRASGDLAKIATFAAEPETHRYLESLVSRAYAEIHETREKPHRLSVLHWFFKTLPRTFRRHITAFWLSASITLVGFVFGGMAMALDPAAKKVILPFQHLQGSPTERVLQEERATRDRLEGVKMTGASGYWTHNTKVSIFTMALGATYGIGTIMLLFYNGIILGAVSIDYMLVGETRFLLAWLMPHGVVEIPAILLAGQAGLILGGTLIGRKKRIPLRMRLREVSGDLVTLVFGVSLMLTWAGFIEAFLSQYHEPVLPYSVKIGFGAVEFVLLIAFFGLSGSKGELRERPEKS